MTYCYNDVLVTIVNDVEALGVVVLYRSFACGRSGRSLMLLKLGFPKISQISHEIICAGFSF